MTYSLFRFLTQGIGSIELNVLLLARAYAISDRKLGLTLATISEKALEILQTTSTQGEMLAQHFPLVAIH
jgi:hypothetical protein